MKVTTNIERNPKAQTLPSESILICMNSVNRAIWTVFFDLEEKTQAYIEHASIKILMSNDGETPHSVIVEMKLKGNETFQFERKFSIAFDTNRHYKNLENEIKAKIKAKIIEIFEGVILHFRNQAEFLKQEFSI